MTKSKRRNCVEVPYTMAWVRDRYYVRSIKENGRVIKEYCGCGRYGHASANEDAQRRADRAAQRADWRARRARVDALVALTDLVCHLADRAARQALTEAGFHQHARGHWRKRRAAKTPLETPASTRNDSASAPNV